MFGTISPKKVDALKKQMESLQIKENDLVEKFILGSSKGGQKLNKTSSCVYLMHLPTKTEVKCQKSRSRAENRFFARRQLCEKIEQPTSQIEKIRKTKQNRKRKAKKKYNPE